MLATDGTQLALPRSKELQSHGFIGQFVHQGAHYVTHMLKMYCVQMVDVFTGVTHCWSFSHVLNELAAAVMMVNGLSSDSLVIYDRLYWSRKLILAHQENKNYFLIRCRSKGVPKSVEIFFTSKEKAKVIYVNG